MKENKELKLSYESDGKMGEQKKRKITIRNIKIFLIPHHPPNKDLV
ncbi:hypothetical protein RCG17_03040 [Neobacillus sp. PS3-12]|nr:hypothetical protein [Neobacillus sp. PS3-12]WML53668.1 hypothetical protein RCG17_03040 [Neobacillus sp. PS3-12]